MKVLDYNTVHAMNPCWLRAEGVEKRLRDACARLGGTFTVVDVLRAEWLDAADRVRIATQDGVLTDRTLRLFVARIARRRLECERAAGREPDSRSWAAVETAERHARGEATDKELAAARAAVKAVVKAAWAAARAAEAAEWAEAEAAAAVAETAAAVAAAVAAEDAAGAAETASLSAAAAAWAAAAAEWAEAEAARTAEWHQQIADLLELLDGGREDGGEKDR